MAATTKAGREVLFDVERAYRPPSTREQGARARAELRLALAAIRRDGWVGLLTGWGLASGPGGDETISPFNLHQVDSGHLEVKGWTLTGALRAHCSDQLGNYYAERYLTKVCPCDVAHHFNAHPHTDAQDAIRLLQKALQLASSDAGVTDLTERTARGAAAPPPPLRRVRSGSR